MHVDLPINSSAGLVNASEIAAVLSKNAPHLEITYDTLHTVDGSAFCRIKLTERSARTEQPAKPKAFRLGKALEALVGGAAFGLGICLLFTLTPAAVRIFVECVKFGWSLGGLWP